MLNDDKFVFISYSNLDEEIVNPFIKAMTEVGIRIWRDQNIKAGTEWADTLQKKLESCDRLVAFTTKNFLKSDFCFREIIYAHTSLYKEILVVCLEDVEEELRKDDTGIDMLLSSRQWIYRDNAENDAEFLTELLQAEFFNSCREQILSKEKLEQTIIPFSPPDESDTSVEPLHSNSSESDVFPKRHNDSPILIASTISSGMKESSKGGITETPPSRSIDISIFKAIRFSCQLLTPFAEATDLPIEINIYNVRNECVFHISKSYSFTPETDDFSFEWEIKNEKGFNVFEEGPYRAFIDAENYSTFKYDFSLVNTHSQKQEIKLNELKNRITHHKLMILKLCIWGLWLLLSASVSIPFLPTLTTIGVIFGMVMLQRKVFLGFLQTYNKNKFIAFIVVIPLGLFYGIYQVCVGLMYLPTYKKDRQDLRELEED